MATFPATDDIRVQWTGIDDASSTRWGVGPDQM